MIMMMRVTLSTLAYLFVGGREVSAALSVRSSSLSTVKKLEKRVAALQRTYTAALGQSCLDLATASASGSSSSDLWEELPTLANNPSQINTQIAQLSSLVASIQADNDFFSNFVEEISTSVTSADISNAFLMHLANLSDVTALQNQIESLQTGLKSMSPNQFASSFTEVIESTQALTTSVLGSFNGTFVYKIRVAIVRTVAAVLLILAILEYRFSISFVCSIEFLQSTLQFPIFTLLELVGYTIGFIACLITLVALCVWLGLHPRIDVPEIDCSGLFPGDRAATTLDCQFRNMVAVSGTTLTQGLNLLNEMPTQALPNSTFWNAYQYYYQQLLEQCSRVYPEP